MQAPNISNTEPLPFGMHHRLRSSRSNLLCPGVVYLDDTTTASVASEKELDGKLSRPWAKIANDDRVHHFFDARLSSADNEEDTDDTSRCCSEESSIDERYLSELWRTDDDEHSSDDECDLSTTGTCSRRSSLQVSPEQSTETKRVRFGSVKVREYGLTVGAYSAAKDSCPLQLSWEHTPEQVYCVESYNSSNKETRQWQTLKRLSLSRRRKRIAKVQGITTQQVALQEYQSTLQVIRASIQCISHHARSGSKQVDRWSPLGTGIKSTLQSDKLFTKSLLREMPPLPLL